MKKIICIVLVFVMTFCGCSRLDVEIVNPTKSSESEAEVSSEIEENFSEAEKNSLDSEKIPKIRPEILYPENVPEELFSSGAFKKAINHPSVILYDNEPISDYFAAVNFVSAFEKEEYAELYIYSFSYIDFDETYRLYFQHFITEDGTIIREGGYRFDWEETMEPTEKTFHNLAEINEFGYFSLEWEWGDFTYVKVISDFELYENAAEHLALKEKYIDPIFTITASPEEFDSPSDFSGRTLLWLFEDIYNHEKGHDPWQELGDNWPVEEMLSLLNRYFEGVTKDMLLYDTPAEYDSETDTIYYPGGRGGVPPERRVFDYKQNGNILTLYYELYNTDSGTVFMSEYYILEIKLLEDGSYRYISQKIAERQK